MRPVAVAVVMSLALGCASGRLPNAPGMDVIVKADPEAISPDASGAKRIAEATGCEVETVRPLALGAVLFRLWPTQRTPDVKACLRKLQGLPGVQWATLDETMNAK